jgi:predicted DNA-binding protein with PD1-like motif
MSNYSPKRIVVGQLARSTDLYDGITRIAQEKRIRTGRITGIGAVTRAKVAYYDQQQMKYNEIELNQPMEILNLNGNISIKDGKPFVHAHIILSDRDGTARGGHLLPGGTPVFACEVIIEELDGPELVRGYEEKTGLALWPTDTTL